MLDIKKKKEINEFNLFRNLFLIIIFIFLIPLISSASDYRFQNTSGTNLTVIHGSNGNLTVWGNISAANFNYSLFISTFNATYDAGLASLNPWKASPGIIYNDTSSVKVGIGTSNPLTIFHINNTNNLLNASYFYQNVTRMNFSYAGKFESFVDGDATSGGLVYLGAVFPRNITRFTAAGTCEGTLDCSYYNGDATSCLALEGLGVCDWDDVIICDNVGATCAGLSASNCVTFTHSYASLGCAFYNGTSTSVEATPYGIYSDKGNNSFGDNVGIGSKALFNESVFVKRGFRLGIGVNSSDSIDVEITIKTNATSPSSPLAETGTIHIGSNSSHELWGYPLINFNLPGAGASFGVPEFRYHIAGGGTILYLNAPTAQGTMHFQVNATDKLKLNYTSFTIQPGVTLMGGSYDSSSGRVVACNASAGTAYDTGNECCSLYGMACFDAWGNNTAGGTTLINGLTGGCGFAFATGNPNNIYAAMCGILNVPL